MRHAGRSALVTGAGTGIGRAIAERLAADGAAVAVNALSAGDAAPTVEAVTAAGGRAVAVVGDVSVEDDVRRIVRECADAFGGLHVAVSNAGFADRAPFLDTTLDSWNAQLATDLTGVFLVCREAGLLMRDAGGGVLVNVSSVHEHRPWLEAAAYCTAKAGVGMLTACAGRELAPYGIRAVAIAPGAIATEANLEAHGGLTSDAIRAQVPAGRMGTPEEVAGVVSWLASDEAAYVTATTFVVDGGFETFGPSV
ncbi:MAG TPA: SDR family oxidoreductase [Frankiaceae bacterium]|nr:SDR family oxidoreductase [Frankiaceae bacterium]